MIIAMQKDAPNQRSCIYKLQTMVKKTKGAKGRDGNKAQETLTEKYFQIRVKTTEFMQKRAVAIYFYNFTSQFNAFDKRLNEKNSNLRV